MSGAGWRPVVEDHTNQLLSTASADCVNRAGEEVSLSEVIETDPDRHYHLGLGQSHQHQALGGMEAKEERHHVHQVTRSPDPDGWRCGGISKVALCLHGTRVAKAAERGGPSRPGVDEETVCVQVRCTYQRVVVATWPAAERASCYRLAQRAGAPAPGRGGQVCRSPLVALGQFSLEVSGVVVGSELPPARRHDPEQRRGAF
jgi:hypothetical protein